MSGRRFREQRGKIPIVLPYEFFLTPLNSCCGNNGWHVFPFLPRHPVGRSVPFALQRRTSPQRDMVRGIRLPDGCGLSFRQSISSDLSRLPSLHDPSRSLRPYTLVPDSPVSRDGYGVLQAPSYSHDLQGKRRILCKSAPCSCKTCKLAPNRQFKELYNID